MTYWTRQQAIKQRQAQRQQRADAVQSWTLITIILIFIAHAMVEAI